jgi:MSHA biogenesis protein MshI
MGVMDSLTVQIQRSMDYFESQLRQAPIRMILMNIESVNSQAIADQIESLMRVDVRPFSCKISSTDINQESVDFSCLGAAYAVIEATKVVARPVK